MIDNVPKFKTPKGRILFTHSLLKDFRLCRRRFFYNYLCLLSPRRLSLPLFMGEFFHEGLDRFYSGKDPDDFIPDIVKEMEQRRRNAVFLDPEEEEQLDVASATIQGMLEAYCRRYQKDLKRWKIVAPEQRFEIPIYGENYFGGKVDLIIKWKGEYWVVEHKTAGRLDKNYISRLPLDFQITGYILGAKRVVGKPIAGIIYNVVKKPWLRKRSGESGANFASRIAQDYHKRPEFYLYRERLYRLTREVHAFKAEISETVHDITNLFAHARKYKKQPDKVLPTFYRNTDACVAKGTCQFMPICTTGWDKSTKALYERRKGFNPELAKEDTA